ncbi:MAG: response regulator [Ignavibacteriales bacterium]|nr:response regulator [Ignavibacteriales bacterium]
MKFLVFDRAMMIRFMITKHINRISDSEEIIAAENVNSVIEHVKEYYFDVLILDMDNLRGYFQLIKKIANERNPGITIILTTNFPNKKINQKFLKLGVEYCYDKVSDFEEFRQKIDDLIGTADLPGDIAFSTAG